MPWPAAAAVVRHALIIANNVGDTGEAVLKYTHNDARRLAEVLTTLGDVAPEHLELVFDADARSIEDRLIATNDRIRSQTAAGDQTVLIVYYSGHADETSLHTGGTRLALNTLQSLVRGSSANFRILMVDACRSGALTRGKGPRRIDAFAIDLDERLPSNGLAFLTSSSAHEDAQESDQLKSSFFTHYFVSALLGAGDANRDDRVDLAEAYAYAYAHTLRASSRSRAGTQHPSYDFDMHGHGSFVLTHLQRSSGQRARLQFPRDRGYLILEGGPEGRVVAELGSADRVRQFLLAPGSYFVRGRARDTLLEGRVTLKAGERLLVEDRMLKRVAFAQLVRKGSDLRKMSHGPIAGYLFRSSLLGLRRPSLCHGTALGYGLDTRHLTLRVRLSYCRERFSAVGASTNNDEYATSLAALRVLDVRDFSLGVGVSGSFGLVYQSYTSTRKTRPRLVAVGFASALLAIAYEFGAGVYVQGELAAGAYLFAQQTGYPPMRSVTAKFVLQPHIGLGKRF